MEVEEEEEEARRRRRRAMTPMKLRLAAVATPLLHAT